jgi:outer membrane immunogenic protein
MKKSVFSLVAGVLIAGPAMAADLGMPVKAPYAPPPAPVVSWTGCYIDGGVGYGMYNQEHSLINTTTVPVTPITTSSNTGGEGWLGRVGAGCDYQISSFVIGAFGDFDFSDLTGTFQDAGIGGGTEKDSGTWHVGGRIGYLVTPSLLGFVSGGYTETRFDRVNLSVFTVPTTPIGFEIPAHNYQGWFIGTGYEYALNSIVPISGLFWRTEYRYSSYGSSDIQVVDSATGAPAGSAVRMQKTNVQTITSGLVWRFNFGGPAAAPY